MLVRLHFGVGGFLEGYKNLDIWKDGDKVYKKYSERFMDEAPMEEVDLNAFMKVSDSLEEIGVQSWEKEYVDPYVLDGTQWELEIQFEGKRKRKIYGSNAYPEKWNEMIEVLSNCAPELLKERLEDDEAEME